MSARAGYPGAPTPAADGVGSTPPVRVVPATCTPAPSSSRNSEGVASRPGLLTPSATSSSSPGCKTPTPSGLPWCTKEGWMHKRGLMHTWKWTLYWCVLEDNVLSYYSDADRSQKKGSIEIGPLTQAVCFRGEGALGDSPKHARERPCGFVLDSDSTSGVRHPLDYFDALDVVQLEAWVHAIKTLARHLVEQHMKVIADLTGQLKAERAGKEASSSSRQLPSDSDDPSEAEHKDVFTSTAFKELCHALQDAQQVLQGSRGLPEVGFLGLSALLEDTTRRIREWNKRAAALGIGSASVPSPDDGAGHVEDIIPSGGQCSKGVAEFIQEEFTKTRSATFHKLREWKYSTSSMDEREMMHGIRTNASFLGSIEEAKLKEWNFDFFKLNDITSGRLLERYGCFVLAPVCNAALRSSAATVTAFMAKIASLYQSNPYHNGVHAAQVCHLSTWLIRHLGVADSQSDIECAALAIAALAHDVGHFGRNNAFCVSTEHALAVRYNNSKVLENMHAATCLEVMQSVNGKDMFEGLNKSERSAIRSEIIEYILATDVAEHFEMLSKFKVRLSKGDLAVGNISDRHFISSMCIKAADIGHAALNWELHETWSVRIIEEFFQQGDEERNLGLPISALCDRNHAGDLGKSQKGFLDFVCLPIFESLTDLHEQAQKQTKVRTNTFSVPPQSVKEPVAERIRRSEDMRTTQGPCFVLRNTCVAEIRANSLRWVNDHAVRERVKSRLRLGDQSPPGAAG